MYACPHCGQPTVSFRMKSKATDFWPQQCSNCHGQFVMNVWPLAFFLPIEMAILGAVAYYFAVNHIPVSLAIVTGLIALSPLLFAQVHFSPLTLATPERARVTNFVRWLVLGGGATWFLWSVFGPRP